MRSNVKLRLNMLHASKFLRTGSKSKLYVGNGSGLPCPECKSGAQKGPHHIVLQECVQHLHAHAAHLVRWGRIRGYHLFWPLHYSLEILNGHCNRMVAWGSDACLHISVTDNFHKLFDSSCTGRAPLHCLCLTVIEVFTCIFISFTS